MGAGNIPVRVSAQTWAEVRRAAEYGVDDGALVKKFGLPSRNALRQRRFREKWMTPHRLVQEIAIRRAKLIPTTVTKESLRNKSAPDAVGAVADRLLELLNNNNLRTAEMADAALQVASHAPPEIKTWNDITQAQKLIRLAAGADSGNEGGNAVQINFAPVFNNAGRVERVVEAEEYGDAIEA